MQPQPLVLNLGESRQASRQEQMSVLLKDYKQ
jgi:hypothetical protein